MFRKIAVSFIVSLVFIAAILVLSGGSGKLLAFVDIPGFILTVVAPFLAVLAGHGPAGFANAFAAPGSASAGKEDLSKSAAFFRSFIRYAVGFATIAFSAGFVMIMVYSAEGADARRIGINVAVAILGYFYAAVVTVLFALPFLGEAERRLAEMK